VEVERCYGQARFVLPHGSRILMMFRLLNVPRVRLVGALCFVLGVVFALLAVALTPMLVGADRGRDNAWKVFARTWTGANIAPVDVPPSGVIEAVEIPLASPDGVFPDREKRLRPAEWCFENIPENRLARFLAACDLRPVERTALLDRRSWRATEHGCTITPPEQLIWSLSPHAREQIYSVLSKSPTNFPQCFPFRWPLDGFDRKFKDSGLPVEQINKIRRLTYTNGEYLCFTDLQAVRAALRRPEFEDLVETLYGLPTYILRLRVNPDSDVEGLVRYWGKGGREKTIAPLLNSLTKVPGGTTINVSHLLPPFARLRLYTYPYTSSDPTAARQDCFFTALNFFNETPNTNFFKAAYAAQALRSDYSPIPRTPSFGDVVLLERANGEVIHACVYIADDFVFSKNGVDPEQPWVLMRMADMLALYYPVDRSGHLAFMRRHRGA
jgi:hypothetical protein